MALVKIGVDSGRFRYVYELPGLFRREGLIRSQKYGLLMTYIEVNQICESRIHRAVCFAHNSQKDKHDPTDGFIIRLVAVTDIVR